MPQIQVTTEHYRFRDYMIKRRWLSIWTQLSELSDLSTNSILEIGPGLGVLQHVARLHRINIDSCDIDPELNPDHIGSITELPLDDDSYDVVCAFQVLEHIEYESVAAGLREMARVSRKYVFLSVPNAQVVWRFHLYFPKYGERRFMFARPFWSPKAHRFNGEHYWELNKLKYSVERFISDIPSCLTIKKHWRDWDNPYHHFFLLQVRDNAS